MVMVMAALIILSTPTPTQPQLDWSLLLLRGLLFGHPTLSTTIRGFGMVMPDDQTVTASVALAVCAFDLRRPRSNIFSEAGATDPFLLIMRSISFQG
jgi:hypothetical protein